MYCSRTLTPSGGRAEQLRGGALGAMPTTKKVLTRAEAKAMALRDGVEQVVLTQDVDDMQRVANERKERAEEARRRLRSSRRKGGEARQGCKNEPRGTRRKRNEVEEEEEEEEEEEDEDEGDEDGEDDDEVDGEESVDGEEEEQQQPDPEAVSEIVQFMVSVETR